MLSVDPPLFRFLLMAASHPDGCRHKPHNGRAAMDIDRSSPLKPSTQTAVKASPADCAHRGYWKTCHLRDNPVSIQDKTPLAPKSKCSIRASNNRLGNRRMPALKRTAIPKVSSPKSFRAKSLFRKFVRAISSSSLNKTLQTKGRRSSHRCSTPDAIQVENPNASVGTPLMRRKRPRDCEHHALPGFRNRWHQPP